MLSPISIFSKASPQRRICVAYMYTHVYNTSTSTFPNFFLSLVPFMSTSVTMFIATGVGTLFLL